MPDGGKCAQKVVFNYFKRSIVYSRLPGRLSIRKGGLVLNLESQNTSSVFLALSVTCYEIPKLWIPKLSLNLPLFVSFSSLVKQSE